MGVSRLQPAGGANDFTLDIGSSGQTTFQLTKEYAPGAYSITSQLADSSLDIYLINSDGSNAGYTNSKSMTATKGFNKIVVYGASNNDLLIFEYKTTFSPTGVGNVDSGAAPFATAVSPSDLPIVNSTTTITGGNFATNVAVTFTGTNAVALNAKSIVRASSTSLLVTRPDNLIQDHSPYDVTITNPGISSPSVNVHRLNDVITAGGDPTWVTAAGPLPAAGIGLDYSVAVSATDPDSGTVTYSLVSGNLPTGLTFNTSTATISGVSNTLGTFTFVIAATDSGNNITNRSFSIEVQRLGLSSTSAVSFPSELVTSGHTTSGNYWLKGTGTTAHQMYCHYDGSSFWVRTANLPRGANIGFNGYSTTSGSDFTLANTSLFNLRTDTFGNATGTNLDVMLRTVGGSFSGAVSSTPGRSVRTLWRGVNLNAALDGASTSSFSSAGSAYSNNAGITWVNFSGNNFTHANAQWNWVISTTDAAAGAYNNPSISGWILHGNGGDDASLMYCFTDTGVQLDGDQSWSRAEIYVRI